MNWFKNLSTMAKLMLAFCMLSAAMAFVGYVSQQLDRVCFEQGHDFGRAPG